MEKIRIYKNPKEFFRRWGEGFRNLPAIELIKAKRNGHIGAVIGGLLAISFLIYYGVWHFVLFMSAITYLQWIELKKTIQQIYGIREMEKQARSFQKKGVDI